MPPTAHQVWAMNWPLRTFCRQDYHQVDELPTEISPESGGFGDFAVFRHWGRMDSI